MKRKGKRIYYGYYITAADWLIYFFTTGASSYGAGIVSTSIVLERGWDQSIIGLSSSMMYLAVAAFAVPISIMEKAKGCRKTVMAGALLGMIAYTGLALYADDPINYVFMFFLLGICSSACGMTTGPTLITAWFKEKRAMNMSVFYTAGAIAGFVMPLISKILSDISVRLCWLVYLIEAFFAFVLAVFVVADRPEEKGQAIDGVQFLEVADAKRSGRAEEDFQSRSVPGISACYHSKRFYSLFFQTFVCRMAHTGIVSYITIYAVQKGISFSAAAVLVTVYSTANFFGRCLIGVSSRLPFTRKMVNLAGFVCMVTGSIILPFADGFAVIASCVLLVGVGAGLSFTVFALLVADCFGDENFMILNGMYSTLGTAGSVTAPVILLLVAEMTGSYGSAYMLIAVLCIFAMILAIVTPIKMLEMNKEKRTSEYLVENDRNML